MGGLPRRSTIIQQKRDQGEAFLLVDTGNFSTATFRIKEDEQMQARRKSEFMMETFALNGVQVLGIGQKDLALGAEWLFQTLERYQLPFVASNLECDGIEIPKFRAVDVDGVSIHFYSLLKESAKIDGCTVLPPQKTWVSLQKENTADLNILFSHLSSVEMVDEILDFDLIIETANGKRVETPESVDGDTVLLGAGTKGKVIGWSTLTLKAGHNGFRASDAGKSLDEEIERWGKKVAALQQEAEQKPESGERLKRQIKYYSDKKDLLEKKRAILETDLKTNDIRNQLIPLDRQVDDHPKVAELLAKALADIEEMTATQSVPSYEGDYVGTQRCIGCHQEQHQQWQTTKHAHAWRSLVSENRAMDLECFACHSTGSLQENGPKHPKQVEQHQLQNVGCESCHGAGAAHSKQPMATNISKEVSIDICTGCHDGVKDEGRFNQETYWPRIVHERSGN